MKPIKLNRLKLFNIALSISGLSLGQFSKLQKPPISRTAVLRTLQGKTISSRIERITDLFIDKYVRPLNIQPQIKDSSIAKKITSPKKGKGR